MDVFFFHMDDFEGFMILQESSLSRFTLQKEATKPLARESLTAAPNKHWSSPLPS